MSKKLFSIAREKTAADWVVRLASDQATAADREHFEEWRGNPANKAEHDAHDEIWQAVGALSHNAEARAILLRPEARAGLTRRHWLAGGAAAAAAIGVAWVTPRFSVETQEFKSVRGERRNIQLSDGSMLVLNTDSVVRVSLLSTERCLTIERGQCFIDVAKDPNRPFRVFAGIHEVRAVGTAFEVYKTAEAVQVTMTEGVVAIYGRRRPGGGIPIYERIVGAPAEKPAAMLSAGKQAKIDVNSSIDIREVDVHQAGAWREGKLVFDEVALSDAIKDVNRYIARQIVLADPALGQLKVSGTFQIAHLDQFAQALTAMFGLHLRDQSDTSTIFRAT